MTGRNQYAWHAWLKPVGLPVAVGLAEWQWERERSVVKVAATAAGALAAVYLVSQIDFTWRRHQWRQRRLQT